MKSITAKSFTRAFQFLALATVLSSCFAPVNLNFESSRLLQKGDVEVQVSASNYSVENSFNPNSNVLFDKSTYQQQNFGAKVGFGVTEKYNIKTKFEGLFASGNNNIYTTSLFFEIDNKINLNKYASLSLPIGMYQLPSYDDLDTRSVAIFQFDPRIYLSYPFSDKFEFTVIPKCHITNLLTFMPGISVGAGFSTNLNEWSIRPELGYDAASFSAGIAFSKNFKTTH
jgi:hypothetical protein